MSSRCTYEGTSYGDAAAPRLAAGSELGSVHVWEVRTPTLTPTPTLTLTLALALALTLTLTLTR